MELMLTPIGLITFGIHVALIIYFSSRLTLGAISLPCLMLLTSMIYFFIMPTLSLANGNFEYFGAYMESLDWMHFSVLLYVVGGAAACIQYMPFLAADPAAPRAVERPMNMKIYLALWAVAVVAAAILVVRGSYNLMADENYVGSESRDFLFLNMAFSMLLPLALMYLVKDDFGPRSILVALVVLLVLVQTGFRFRIMIYLCAIVGAYAITRRIKIYPAYVVPGVVLALMIVNAYGRSRKYGNGINLETIQNMSLGDMLVEFGGEVGPVFTLAHFTNRPLPDWITIEPWVIGIARMVPSAIWPDKPAPTYLYDNVNSAFTAQNIENAGVASTQHMELLLQFGWFGLPMLTYLYYTIAALLVWRVLRMGREARISACALFPAFFGFFMQQRGYFFMTFSEALFMIGPFYMVHFGQRLVPKMYPGANMRRAMPVAFNRPVDGPQAEVRRAEQP